MFIGWLGTKFICFEDKEGDNSFPSIESLEREKRPASMGDFQYAIPFSPLRLLYYWIFERLKSKTDSTIHSAAYTLLLR